MQYTVFLIGSPVAAVCLVAAAVLIRRQPLPLLSRPLAWSVWLCLAFLAANTLELAWPTETGTLLFAKLGYLFSTPIPVFFFLFTMAYIGRADLFSGRRALVLFIVPLVVTALAFTEPLHHLIWTSTSYVPVGRMLAMRVTYGPFFWVNTIYVIGLFLLSLALFTRAGVQAGSAHRGSSMLATAGIAVPLLLFLVYSLKLIPGLTKNFSPIAYAAPAVCLVAAIRRLRFLELVPIARRALVEEMDEAMVVVDFDSRVLDLNGRARVILGLAEHAVGSALPRDSALCQALQSTLRPGAPQQLEWEVAGERRIYDARVTEVRRRRQRAEGWIVMLHDVTTTQRLLEEKNRLIEELSKAAAEIHDLRGILPICMHCKKIRDDTGYWHAVESYISKRSEAQFTHSLCPDCLKKYYPE